MVADQTGDQIRSEVKEQIIIFLTGFKPLPALFNDALFETNADDRLCGRFHIEFRTDHGKSGALIVECLADSDRYLSVLISESHKIWNGPGSQQAEPLPAEPFTETRAGFIRTRSAISVSRLQRSRISELARLANGGLSRKDS